MESKTNNRNFLFWGNLMYEVYRLFFDNEYENKLPLEEGFDFRNELYSDGSDSQDELGRTHLKSEESLCHEFESLIFISMLILAVNKKKTNFTFTIVKYWMEHNVEYKEILLQLASWASNIPTLIKVAYKYDDFQAKNNFSKMLTYIVDRYYNYGDSVESYYTSRNEESFDNIFTSFSHPFEKFPKKTKADREFKVLFVSAINFIESRLQYNPKIVKRNFQSVYEEAIENFINDYGQKKYLKIEGVIRNSNKLKKLLHTFKENAIAPSAEGINIFLRSIGYFTLSPKRNISIAGVIYIFEWNSTCNTDYRILSEDEVIDLLNELF